MSLRTLILLLACGGLALSLVSVSISYVLVAEQMQYILPYADEGNTARSIQILLMQHSAIILTFSTLITVVSFLILSRSIVKPLGAMVEAIEGFMFKNEKLVLSDFVEAPAEIRKLAEVLSEFAIKSEEAHVRDTEISRVKSDFISTAAHQFRTPLTGIRWALEALEKEPLTGSQKALVASAVEKSHSLVSIVGTLLDISSIESGKYKYQFIAGDLNELVRVTVRDFGELAARTQVSVIFVPSETPPPPVRMDRERIRWVLNNIIENALRYTPPNGSVRVTIEVSAARAYVHVRDTGIGIQPKDQGNIFERFYRAENAVTKENSGNGLGLYIARTIATDHGGDLNFKANEGALGTTFTLALPILRDG